MLFSAWCRTEFALVTRFSEWVAAVSPAGLEPARDASQLFLFRGLGLRELSERTHNPVRAALPLVHTLLGRKGG
jgi:hypothetical protein